MRALCVFAFLLFFGQSCLAQDMKLPSVDTLQNLSDDTPRSELFKLITQAEATPSDSIQYFSLYGPFTFPNDTAYDVIEKKARAASIFGVDISHYTQDDFPFSRLADKSIHFVYAKTSQGIRFKDPKFGQFWKAMSELSGTQRVHRGAYHFLTAGEDGATQAATFVSVLNASGGLNATDMPPVVDLEWDVTKTERDRWTNSSADEIIQNVKAWLRAVERATGRKPMIYTALAWWKERIGSESRFSELSDYPIWIADYSKSSRAVEIPKVPNGSSWKLWQFTDAAKFAAGFPNSFDASIFKGNEAEFYSALNVAGF